MVTSTEKPVSGDGDSAPLIPKADGLPVGNYRIVGWDLDISGRRLVDEILQIAAYTPDKEFSLYVMPSRNLNLAARRRHKLKVVTINRYRVLKHVKNGKPIKTKSEISGLRDFVEWLEEVKGDAKDGIILVFHDQIQACPALLLHCLGRYPHADLQERFRKVVAGFANGFALAQSKCAKTTTNFSLRTLSSVLLEKEGSQESAADRSKLIYQVLQKLCTEDGADNTGAGDSAASNVASMISCVREFTQPCRREEELLAEQQELIKRQDALRPVFLHMMKGSRQDKLRACALRRQLLEANITLTLLTEAWSSGQKESVEKLLKEKVQLSDEKDLEELLTKIEWHFVPELRPSFSKRSRKSSRSDKTNGTSENGSSEASTPTETPEAPAMTAVKAPSTPEVPSSPEEPTTPEKVQPTQEKSPKSKKSKSRASPEKQSASPEKTPTTPEKPTADKPPTSPEPTATSEKPPASPEKSASPEKTPSSPKSKSKSNKNRKSPEKSRNKAKESQGAVAC